MEPFKGYWDENDKFHELSASATAPPVSVENVAERWMVSRQVITDGEPYPERDATDPPAANNSPWVYGFIGAALATVFWFGIFVFSVPL